jgi:hypothetical protein
MAVQQDSRVGCEFGPAASSSLLIAYGRRSSSPPLTGGQVSSYFSGRDHRRLL